MKTHLVKLKSEIEEKDRRIKILSFILKKIKKKKEEKIRKKEIFDLEKIESEIMNL